MAVYAYIPFTKASQGALPVADAIHSPKLRAHAISGTAMAPTLRCGDFVLLAPVAQYQGEGVYLIDQGDRTPVLSRVMTWTSIDEMRLSFDAVPHAPYFMPREKFDERVLGMVVAEIRVTEPGIIHQAIGLAA